MHMRSHSASNSCATRRTGLALKPSVHVFGSDLPSSCFGDTSSTSTAIASSNNVLVAQSLSMPAHPAPLRLVSCPICKMHFQAALLRSHVESCVQPLCQLPKPAPIASSRGSMDDFETLSSLKDLVALHFEISSMAISKRIALQEAFYRLARAASAAAPLVPAHDQSTRARVQAGDLVPAQSSRVQSGHGDVEVIQLCFTPPKSSAADDAYVGPDSVHVPAALSTSSAPLVDIATAASASNSSRIVDSSPAAGMAAPRARFLLAEQAGSLPLAVSAAAAAVPRTFTVSTNTKETKLSSKAHRDAISDHEYEFTTPPLRFQSLPWGVQPLHIPDAYAYAHCSQPARCDSSTSLFSPPSNCNNIAVSTPASAATVLTQDFLQGRLSNSGSSAPSLDAFFDVPEKGTVSLWDTLACDTFSRCVSPGPFGAGFLMDNSETSTGMHSNDHDDVCDDLSFKFDHAYEEADLLQLAPAAEQWQWQAVSAVASDVVDDRDGSRPVRSVGSLPSVSAYNTYSHLELDSGTGHDHAYDAYAHACAPVPIARPRPQAATCARTISDLEADTPLLLSGRREPLQLDRSTLSISTKLSRKRTAARARARLFTEFKPCASESEMELQPLGISPIGMRCSTVSAGTPAPLKKVRHRVAMEATVMTSLGACMHLH